MEIKLAIFDDLNEILELQKLCYLENAERYNDNTIQPLTQSINEIQEEFKIQTFLKIMYNSKIIGSVRAFVNNDTCFIGKLIVHPDYQNIGIGKKLMLKIEKIFNSVKRFELFTGYKDEKNLYFYKKLGYSIFKENFVSNNIKFIYLEKYNKNTLDLNIDYEQVKGNIE
ncbi:MAG TPA: GNAT family N-acetyltransferase [Spirochaetota bacterium]|nr:GNAT family N-acetyltransferase [Spirochaetota bacterium]HOS56424.1 GNAT family N-acetyltransferase [Spirochaetota bacterium]HPK61357.1 GNAT family N-acetyltransferase [Spirochaetota bacterium]HQF78266.1 GNAT family N-acetyltransferase [Spirochaetota bacterium]HQH31036.1 GNAT family N-acetyltransferase [Spirochaetota bacterium]